MTDQLEIVVPVASQQRDPAPSIVGCIRL